MSEIVLHHYPRSPFAEKARLVLGFKGIAWRGVIIPRWMPKPDLMPLTGGYRKTPVLQIGADVFCDTRLILRELERRHPSPSLYPKGTAGVADALAAWADSRLFIDAVGVVFGTLADQFPADLKQDRAKFTDGLLDAERLKANQPAVRDQFRARSAFIEEMLGDGRQYLLGGAPSMADFAAYHPLWFVRGNLQEGWTFAGRPRTLAWMDRIAAVGHATSTELDAKEALAIAKAATPAPAKGIAAGELRSFKAGEPVTVAANDYGRDPVAGKLATLDAEEIAIRREAPEVGEVVLHFPRAGFDIRAA